MSMHTPVPCGGRPMTTVMRHKKIPLFAGVSLLLLVSLLMSCSTPTGQKAPAAAAKTEKAEKIRQAGPAPGDVRLENGIEYVYGRNPKFGMGPDEPEHIWLRKEDYSPGRTGSGYVRTDPAAEKERKELLERLEKLEAEVKKQNGNSQ